MTETDPVEETEQETYIGKCIVVFGDDGVGQYSIEWPWPENSLEFYQSQDHRVAILDMAAPGTYWVDDIGEVYTRQSAPDIQASRLRLISDGDDFVTLTGLPDPCWLSVAGEEHEAVGGSLEISTHNAGDLFVSYARTHTGNPIKLTALTLEQSRLDRWEEAKLVREEKINGGCMTPFGKADSDPESRSNISGAVQMANFALASQENYEVEWTMFDNSIVTLNALEMIAMGIAVGQHVNACHTAARNVRNEIDLATSIESLDQIDLTMGYPS